MFYLTACPEGDFTSKILTLQNVKMSTIVLFFHGFHGYPYNNKLRVLRSTEVCCSERSLSLELSDRGKSGPQSHNLSKAFLDTTSPMPSAHHVTFPFPAPSILPRPLDLIAPILRKYKI
jgi:hypothetical protein